MHIIKKETLDYINASIVESKKVDKVLPLNIRDLLVTKADSWSKENLIKLSNQNTLEFLNNTPPEKYLVVSPGTSFTQKGLKLKFDP